jgi:hypothetical protein
VLYSATLFRLHLRVSSCLNVDSFRHPLITSRRPSPRLATPGRLVDIIASFVSRAPLSHQSPVQSVGLPHLVKLCHPHSRSSPRFSSRSLSRSFFVPSSPHPVVSHSRCSDVRRLLIPSFLSPTHPVVSSLLVSPLVPKSGSSLSHSSFLGLIPFFTAHRHPKSQSTSRIWVSVIVGDGAWKGRESLVSSHLDRPLSLVSSRPCLVPRRCPLVRCLVRCHVLSPRLSSCSFVSSWLGSAHPLVHRLMHCHLVATSSCPL